MSDPRPLTGHGAIEEVIEPMKVVVEEEAHPDPVSRRWVVNWTEWRRFGLFLAVFLAAWTIPCS